MLCDGYHDVPAGKMAVIVTYLEMFKPPDLTPVPLNKDVRFRRVNATIDWYRDIFTRVGAENWLWYSRLVLDDATLQAILDDPLVDIYTLETHGQDEALLELDFRTTGECELAFFGLTQKLIGSGAGRYLMNEAITRAFAKKISRLHVHTCTADSPQALGFYRRCGFTPVCQKVEIDDDPRVVGLLSRSTGPHVPIFDS